LGWYIAQRAAAKATARVRKRRIRPLRDRAFVDKRRTLWHELELGCDFD
jgi:hypothetical protein